MATLPTALKTPDGRIYHCIAHYNERTHEWSGYIIHDGAFWKHLGKFNSIQEIEEAGKKATGGTNNVYVSKPKMLESPGKEKISD